jgi:outer membrane protein TolC
VRSGYRSAKEGAAAAEQAGDDAAAVIATGARTSYYLALLAKERTEIARRSLEQAERNVEQITARVARGVTPEFEKLRAQVTVANRKAFLTRTRNEEVITLASLKRLLGVPLDRPVVLTDDLAYIPYDETLDAVVDRALRARRDLAAVRSEALSLEYRYKAQRVNQRPLLYLDGHIRWQGQTSDNFWPGENQTAESMGVGLALEWPLFDGLRNKNETRTAKALSDKARLRVRQLEDVVRLEVRTSWSDVQSIAEEIIGAEQAVDVAREAYEIAQVRYNTGVSTLVEFLDSEFALIEAALSLSETLYRYNVSLALLEYNIGEGPRLALENGE